MAVFLRVLLAIAGCLSWFPAAFADDVSFGADALGPLSQEASLVATASRPRRLAADEATANDFTRARYVGYAVTIDEVILGQSQAGGEIKVAFPESLDVAHIEDLSGAVVFLRPFARIDVDQTNLQPADDVFLVVGGRYGVVDAKVPNRKAAIEAYLGGSHADAARSERVLSWTEQYVNSADPFLQRSAVVDLYLERKNPRAQRQLSGALLSDDVLTASKGTAIDALRASGTPAAAAALKDLAENNRQQPLLRTQAVKAFGKVPGAEEQLQRWRGSGDRVLSPAAAEALSERR